MRTEEIQYIDEDEIDLKELWQTIMKYKFKLAIFTFIITFVAILFTLTKPNSYTSTTFLVPQEKSSMPSLGGFSALAGMAGISLGGGSMDAASTWDVTIKDFTFNAMVIEKYKLYEKISARAMEKNMVFALGSSFMYDLTHINTQGEEDPDPDRDTVIYTTYKAIQNLISFSSDKKTGGMTLSATTVDRFLSKMLVDIYLKELSTYIKDREMTEVNKKIGYYKQELMNTVDVALKQQLGQLLSGLMQKKVLSQASEFYNVSKITDATVANVTDKSKPKRGLIVIVSFVTSLILGIFGIFFLEFIRNEAGKDKDEA